MPISRRAAHAVAVVVLVGSSLSAPAAAADDDQARIDVRLVTAPPADTVEAFAHFAPAIEFSAGVEVVEAAGVTVDVALPAAHAVGITGSARSVMSLATSPSVVFLEAAGVEPLAMSTAGWVTRVRTLYEPTEGLDLRVTAPDGSPVDGRGVGIAIIDTGIDATHPDLRWQGLDGAGAKVARNYKVICSAPVDPTVGSDTGCSREVVLAELPNTDLTSGHGTHVSGIAAGSGAASDGYEAGAAPGAILYGFASGEGPTILTKNAAAAMQWIYDNGDDVQPPIRVVNNSYGSTGDHDPEFVLSKLSTALVEDREVTMVFAAGNGDLLNDGGDGSDDRVSRHAKNPVPGVIGVANYDEANHELSSTSSRGLRDDPATWPDLTAPGTFIMAPCAPASALCYSNPPWYTPRSGTSMAAPHVAGIAALLYQVDVDITPAEVEHRLESTAHRFGDLGGYQPDPAHPEAALSSFDKGHGMVDARSVVLAALGLPPDHGLGSGAAQRRLAQPDPENDGVVGAADFVNVDIIELDDGTVRVAYTMRDVDDLPPTGAVEFTMFGSISSSGEFQPRMTWDGTSVAGTGDVRPSLAGRDGNTLYADYPLSLTQVSRGDVLSIDFVGSYLPGIHDAVPADGHVEWELARPHFDEYVFSGPR